MNESQDDKSQIEEFLREYKGEGIQHIALGSDDIYATVDILRGRGIPFQDTPDTYYELVDERVKAMASRPPSSRSAASWSTARRPRARACCCRSSPRM